MNTKKKNTLMLMLSRVGGGPDENSHNIYGKIEGKKWPFLGNLPITFLMLLKIRCSLTSVLHVIDGLPLF